MKRRRGMCLMELALRSKLWTSTEMHPQAKELYCRSLRDAPTVSQEPCLVISIPTQATRVSSDIPGLSECATVIPSMSMILSCGRSLRWTPVWSSLPQWWLLPYDALWSIACISAVGACCLQGLLFVFVFWNGTKSTCLYGLCVKWFFVGMRICIHLHSYVNSHLM